MASTVILVNGLPGAGKTTLARQVQVVSGWPLLSKDEVKEALALIAGGYITSGQLGAVAMNTVWSMAAAMTGTVVLDSWWFRPRDLDFTREGVVTAEASLVVEVWCEVTPALARERYAGRRRAPVHEDCGRLAADFDHWASHGAPLALGPVLRVDTSGPVDVSAVVTQLKTMTPI